MNNKGFTLIELIATILLIVLSSTVVVINLGGSTSKQEQTLAEKNNKRMAFRLDSDIVYEIKLNILK